MTTRPAPEDIETTRAEKVLALALAAFLLLGGLWIYFRVDDAVPGPAPYEQVLAGRPGEARAIAQHDRALELVVRAEVRSDGARSAVVDRREAYRTALDAGAAAEGLRQAYVAAQARSAAAGRALAEARRAERAASPAADRARATVGAVLERDADRHTLLAFLARLGYVIAALAAAIWTLGRLRRRGSRYLVAGLALVGAASAQGVAMAGDYLTDHLDVVELGPIILSVVGAALTLAGLVALQRYLARRLPERRVRKGLCPFCGYPARDNHRCEGCGRAVVGACTVCRADRRTGSRHCGACGAA